MKEDYYDEEGDELEWDDVEEYDAEGNSLTYIETDLTEKEKASFARFRKRYREHPEEFISLEDLWKKCGRTPPSEESIAKIKHVYR